MEEGCHPNDVAVRLERMPPDPKPSFLVGPNIEYFLGGAKFLEFFLGNMRNEVLNGSKK